MNDNNKKMGRLEAVLRNKFDSVYILSLINRKDRQKSIKRQLKALNLPEPDTTEFIRWYWAVPFPYNDLIANAFNVSKRGKFTKPNEYDCARNHYNIVKINYELGHKNFLIIEDDILFYNDEEIIAQFIENLPEDYDVAQFGGFTADPRIKQYLTDRNNGNRFWCKHPKTGIWNTSMVAYSRKGMEYYTAFMDKVFWVADGPIYKANVNSKLVNSYISRLPVVIQADKDVLLSDIRDEKNDDIDYKTENIYEAGIDKSKYFSVFND